MTRSFHHSLRMMIRERKRLSLYFLVVSHDGIRVHESIRTTGALYSNCFPVYNFPHIFIESWLFHTIHTLMFLLSLLLKTLELIFTIALSVVGTDMSIFSDVGYESFILILDHQRDLVGLSMSFGR